MREQNEGREVVNISKLMKDSQSDPKARKQLEELGYKQVFVCASCGAKNVGPAHTLGCMSYLNSEWEKKDTE